MRWLFLFALIASPASAEMYKCMVGKKIVYQDIACPNAKVINNINGIAPPLEDRLNALRRAESDRAIATQDIQKPIIKRQKSGRLDRGINPNSSQTADTGNRYFSNDGSIIERPPGSSFSHDNRGNTYYQPEGSAFSHGKDGRTCFHYGDFADCK